MNVRTMEMGVYEPPCVEIIEVMVEQGFALSTSTEDITYSSEDNEW